ncbi:MAG: hypothetical protein ACRELF_20225, partial [Gemmataceae bacterium]
ESASATEVPDLEAFAAVEKIEPSAIEKELRALEEDFLSRPGGLEDEGRQTLWPRLAVLNTHLNKTEDAGLCWLHALWETGEIAKVADKWSTAWFRGEMLGAARHRAAGSQCVPSWLAALGREVQGADLDRLLECSDPTSAELRCLAAYLVWSAQRTPRPEPLMQRLSAVQRFLEKHEKLLPVRACWLAWHHLTQLLDGDVLALARARDRLLERLFHNGLRPEQDLPSFLRFAGHPDSRRCGEVREWLKKGSEKVRDWVEENRDLLDRQTPTMAYAQLLFAFGLARLGENDDAKRLLHGARQVLSAENQVHRFLLRAFEARIHTVLDGKACSGPLPQPLLKELEDMTMLDRYVVERLRHNSRILEPDWQINPYRHWESRQSALDKALAELADLTDRLEVQTRIRALLNKPSKNQAAEERLKILRVGLELGPHVGEEFAREILALTLPAFTSLSDPSEHAVLE